MRGAALCLAIFVFGCAIEVKTRESPDVDLARYRTWAHAPAPWTHPAVGDAIEAEIAAVFAAKGYEVAAVDEADLHVAYRASGVRRGEWKDRDAYVVSDYVAGTLVIELLERASREPLWRGQGEVDLYAVSEPDVPEVAATSVRAILAELPERPEEEQT